MNELIPAGVMGLGKQCSLLLMHFHQINLSHRTVTRIMQRSIWSIAHLLRVGTSFQKEKNLPSDNDAATGKIMWV